MKRINIVIHMDETVNLKWNLYHRRENIQRYFFPKMLARDKDESI